MDVLFSSPSIIRVSTTRRLGWAEHVTSTEKRRSAYMDLVVKHDGKRAPGTSRDK